MNNSEKFLIDTDVLINHLRGIKIDVLNKFYKRGILYTTAINWWEILRNVREKEKDIVNALLKNLECIPITCEIGRISAEYYLVYKQYNLEIDDLLIAATAKYNKMILVTNNVKHFPFADITIEIP